jgi:hypothetical protein
MAHHPPQAKPADRFRNVGSETNGVPISSLISNLIHLATLGRVSSRALRGVLISLANLAVLVANAGPAVITPRLGSPTICGQQTKTPQRPGGMLAFSARAPMAVWR